MKNSLQFLAIIAFAAMVGFSMTACNRGGGDRGGGIPGIGGGGTFTVTGIPSEYNGMYASFTGNDESNADFSAISWEKLATLEKNSRISNGRVVLPLWIQPDADNEPDVFIRYSGNHTLTVNFYLHSSSSDLFPLRFQFWQFSSVAFTSGSASRDWSDGEYYGPDM
ncbi:MAG: hypothetical protein FWG89_03975 [Treponema sp.]|nr:hypothetical protein [Treponema sp.]